LEVFAIFCKRCLTIGVSYNMLAQENFIDALGTARSHDELLKKAPETCKALKFFGIPISVKDNYIQKGHDATIGCASKLNKPH